MDNTKGIGRPSQSTPSVVKGKNYLLTIGIDDYPHHRRLDKAVADASGFADVMTTRYGFVHLHPPLLNGEANQRNIRKAIGKCESLNDSDSLVVYYSGHGWYKPSAKLGYIVPADAEDDPHSDFISVSQITDIFRAVSARHILLIVDCCFGGSFGVERDVKVDVKMTEKYIANLDAKCSRMVLSSGGIEPVTEGLVASNNSPFTAPLLEILTANQQPTIVLSEFFNPLAKKTLWNADQIPQYKVLKHLGHADGELAFYCTDLVSPEERAYNEALETDSIFVLEKFIRDFPKSEHKAAIRNRLKEKRAEAAWEKIKSSRHYEKFDEFLDDYEDSPFAELARQKMTELAAHIKVETPKPEIIKPSVIFTPPQYEFEPEMVFVKGGSFKMGSNEEDSEKPIHDVTISDFYMGKFPITQAQWQAVMGNNPSDFKGDEKCPVENVNWDDCQEFIKKLEGKTAKKYRLPTEAEWEYACRAGTTTPFNTGDNLTTDQANYDGNYPYKNNPKGQYLSKTTPVGNYVPNAWGLYDMHGNIWEWCQDWYDADFYKNSPKEDPICTNNKSSFRVLRGGSWDFSAQDCRSASRSNNAPDSRSNSVGFRLVFVP